MALKLTRKGVVVISSLIAFFLLAISGVTLWYLMNNDEIVGPGDGQASSLCCAAFTCNDGTRYGEDFYYGGSNCAERLSQCDDKGGVREGGDQMDCAASCGGPGEACCPGNGCLNSLTCQNGTCSTPPQNQNDCKGVCDAGGCSLSGDKCPSGAKFGTSYCGGKRNDGCNDAIPTFIRSNGNGAIITNDPSLWCSTAQVDLNEAGQSGVAGDRAIVVYIGDGGKTCDAEDSNCVSTLDWDCGEEVSKPICESLTMTTTSGQGFESVTSLDQEINITVKGKRGDGGPAHELAIYAAINGQNNSNNKDFICTPDNYYCGGPKVWALVGKQSNTSSFTTRTSFNQIKAKLLALGTTISSSEIDRNGIVLTTNVSGIDQNDICSSNIAYNGGMGAHYNGGKWDVACDGGCVRWLLYEPQQIVKQCNQSCTSNADCASGLVCDTNGSKTCRNNSCKSDSDCECNVTPDEPYCGDNTCNQANEMCENGISCEDGSSVTCRNNCTYCGDGKKNGNEQCDDGNDIDTDACRNNCTKPSCGDGNVDEGEECDDGNDSDDDACNNDCEEPKPPVWTIEKEGSPACYEGKETYADIVYKITVKNTGTGKGEIDKVVDTPDQKVLENWIYPNSIKPTSGSYVNGKITWTLTGEEKTLQPGESKEFVYSVNVPQTGFGTITNEAELYPEDGDVVTVNNQESVMCGSGPLPETGLFDSTMAKVGIGLVLISLSGLYFYWGGTDSYLMRLMYKEERVARNREKFEGGMRDEE